MLMPLGWLYGKIADARNALYDRGIFASHSLGARTISIGNITAGGTGKTPLVALVAEILTENGEKVCILTRGYGRSKPRERVLVSDGETVLVDAKTGGDEPIELARKLIGKAIVVADANRVAAAKWAKEKFGVTAFVLDDGLQHRKAKRDLDIVCIDAANPFGNGQMLPVGILREPVRNLDRANVVVIARSAMAENIEDLKSQISKLNPNAQVFLGENRISDIIALEEFHAKAQNTRRENTNNGADRLSFEADSMKTEVRVLAFCALGNPKNFFKQHDDKFELAATKAFPDHHFYKQADIDRLTKQAKENGAEMLLTTAKDAVKLKNLKFEIPCFVVEIETVIDDAATFRNLISFS